MKWIQFYLHTPTTIQCHHSNCRLFYFPISWIIYIMWACCIIWHWGSVRFICVTLWSDCSKAARSQREQFAVSSLEMGKRYIVTLIAYRGSKRSQVVETIFKTGLCSSLSWYFTFLYWNTWSRLLSVVFTSHLPPCSWRPKPLPHGLRSGHEERK